MHPLCPLCPLWSLFFMKIGVLALQGDFDAHRKRLEELGAEAVFVGSGIFMNDSTTFAPPDEAERRARAIVKAATHFNDPKVLLEVSEDAGSAMKGLAVSALDEASMLQTRGW